jgi:hypothetical protein
MVQFLIEAMTLTGFGGLVGLGIGWLLTLLVKLIMPSYVPLWAPAAGFFASVGIGVIFGLWPAWKARSSIRSNRCDTSSQYHLRQQMDPSLSIDCRTHPLTRMVLTSDCRSYCL